PPQSPSTIETLAPQSTSPHGRFWLSKPRMIVDISVACGAGSDCDPIFITSFRQSVVEPIPGAEKPPAMTSPICWELGVAPTRKPVFRSCDVAPAIAAAMQTTDP